MASIYDARRANARRIGERIKGYLDTGHLVLDDEGNIVTSVHFTGFRRSEGGLSFGYGDGSRETVVHFEDDVDLDNGMHDTVAAFNAKFAAWKVLHPADLKPIVV